MPTRLRSSRQTASASSAPAGGRGPHAVIPTGGAWSPDGVHEVAALDLDSGQATGSPSGRAPPGYSPDGQFLFVCCEAAGQVAVLALRQLVSARGPSARARPREAVFALRDLLAQDKKTRREESPRLLPRAKAPPRAFPEGGPPVQGSGADDEVLVAAAGARDAAGRHGVDPVDSRIDVVATSAPGAVIRVLNRRWT